MVLSGKGLKLYPSARNYRSGIGKVLWLQNWLDPVMGIAGGLVITRWFYALIKETNPVLPDERLDLKYKVAIKEKIESGADNRISDLHIK